MSSEPFILITFSTHLNDEIREFLSMALPTLFLPWHEANGLACGDLHLVISLRTSKS